MTRHSDGAQTRADLRGSLTPARTFVIQLRSDSDVPRRHLSGRVEHLMSGCSEPFTSLAGLLEFMARYTEATTARVSADAATESDQKDRHGK